MTNELAAFRAGNARTVNVGTLLDLLRRRRRTTRTELIRLSGLSKATVSVIVAELIEQGFAGAAGKQHGNRGRSRELLEFNPRARSVLGAQIGDDVCAAVLTDLDARPYADTRVHIGSTEPDRVVDAVVAAVTELRGAASSPILGLGVGTPGDVDRPGRRINLAVSHGWRDVPMADLLEERLGLPVVVANRAKVAALGQLGLDQRDPPTDLIYVFLGSGIIAGLVVDGQLCFGRDGGAGDIGHVTVQPDGALCGCGNRGCLYTVAGEQAILALARAKARDADPPGLLHALTDGRLGELRLATLAEAAAHEDATALAVLDEVGRWLGIVIANLVNTLNPEAVVLGGPGAQLGQPLLEPVRREVRQRALTEATRKLDLTLSRSGEESGATGAAALWINRTLTSAGPLMLLHPPTPS